MRPVRRKAHFAARFQHPRQFRPGTRAGSGGASSGGFLARGRGTGCRRGRGRRPGSRAITSRASPWCRRTFWTPLSSIWRRHEATPFRNGSTPMKRASGCATACATRCSPPPKPISRTISPSPLGAGLGGGAGDRSRARRFGTPSPPAALRKGEATAPPIDRPLLRQRQVRQQRLHQPGLARFQRAGLGAAVGAEGSGDQISGCQFQGARLYRTPDT